MIKVPDYLTLKHYKYMSINPDISNIDDKLELIAFICDITVDELRDHTPATIGECFSSIMDKVDKLDKEFRPVIKWNGVDYGYQPLHKMSFGEQIDLDNFLKEADWNIYDVLSILYRPIKTNHIGSFTYNVKAAYKIATNEQINDFDFYEVEPYTVVKRKQQAEIMKDFPAEIAIGGLNFFTLAKNHFLNPTQTYSLQTWKHLMKEMKKKMTLSQNITAGWSQLKHLQIQKY
jgi:hypothetical protein